MIPQASVFVVLACSCGVVTQKLKYGSAAKAVERTCCPKSKVHRPWRKAQRRRLSVSYSCRSRASSLFSSNHSVRPRQHIRRNHFNFGFWIADFGLIDQRITLSALARTLGGMLNPICLAAFRLMTSSNFVGCSTGRSAGFAPLRILSTYVAARCNKAGKLVP